MKTRTLKAPARRSSAAMSLVEMVVATGIGALLLASAGTVFLYSLFSFAGLGNYAILTGQSKLSLDYISREMREANRVVTCSSNAAGKTMVFTNSITSSLVTLNWSADTRMLTFEKTGEAPRTFLTGCDRWDFTLYQRSPSSSWGFYPTTDLSLCRLVNMNWKCSRSILGKKINTETVVTAQVVLRNPS